MGYLSRLSQSSVSLLASAEKKEWIIKLRGFWQKHIGPLAEDSTFGLLQGNGIFSIIGNHPLSEIFHSNKWLKQQNNTAPPLERQWKTQARDLVLTGSLLIIRSDHKFVKLLISVSHRRYPLIQLHSYISLGTGSMIGRINEYYVPSFPGKRRHDLHSWTIFGITKKCY